MSSTLSITFDHAGLDAALEGLADVLQAAIRPAAQAGAEVFYQAARRLAPVAKKTTFIPRRKSKITGKSYGGYTIKPGQLRDSIYQVFSKSQSTRERAVYEISWNHYKAPHGHWIEHGNARHPAHPFIRPAYYAARENALQAAFAEYETRVRAATGSRL